MAAPASLSDAPSSTSVSTNASSASMSSSSLPQRRQWLAAGDELAGAVVERWTAGARRIGRLTAL